MKILFLTDNFFPETNAPAKRTLEHCKKWSDMGFEITVITGVPNFPKGKIFNGYKNKIYQIEKIHGIIVKRVWTFIYPNKGFFLRVLDYLSFMFSSLVCGLLSAKKDVIIATSPQFFTLISGFFISKIKKIPLVLEIRDLWPESIVSVGVMKEKSFLITFLKKIAISLYNQSELIVCVTNSFKNDLIKKGVNENKIKVIPNGFEIDKSLKPSESINKVLRRYGINNDKFIISFTGTIGMAHGLEIILDAASQVSDDIIFFVIGEGARKKILIDKAKKRSINNIFFIDHLEWQEIVNINQIIDVHLVHLIKNDEFKKVIPSKVFESMALKKPIIMGVDGESRKILDDAECSINIEPENANDLVKAIYYFKNNPEEIDRKGIKGFNYMLKNFSREILANKMIENIKSLV
tara:strand:- start:1343 stop:2563 length:1221 start_codon:yes stop_codon:yes gene_type:complete